MITSKECAFINKIKSHTKSVVEYNQNRFLPVFNTGKIFNTKKYHYLDRSFSYAYSADEPDKAYGIIYVENMPYRSLFKRRSNSSFMATIDRMVYDNELVPFMLFINKRFIPWEKIQIIHDYNDNWLKINDYRYNYYTIKDIDMIVLPYNIGYLYTEPDYIFNRNFEALKSYINDSAVIKNDRLYINIPYTNDDYTYENNTYNVGFWMYNQIKLQKMDMLSEDRYDKLRKISVIKNNDDGSLAFSNTVNIFDRDSYIETDIDSMCNIDDSNILFKFNDDGELVDYGDKIIYLIDKNEISVRQKIHNNTPIIIDNEDDILNKLSKRNFIIFKNNLLCTNVDIIFGKCNHYIIRERGVLISSVLPVGLQSKLGGYDKEHDDNTIKKSAYKLDKSDSTTDDEDIIFTNTLSAPLQSELNSKYKEEEREPNETIPDFNTFIFYKEEVETAICHKNKFNNLKYISNNAYGQLISDPNYVEYITTIDEPLDFKLSDKYLYDDNFSNAMKETINYDPTLLNGLYEHCIESKCITGKEANERIELKNGKRGLIISTNNCEHHETYVLVFVNGELIKTYSDMIVYANYLYIPVDWSFNDNDIIEFLYFLDVNNNELEFTYNKNYKMFNNVIPKEDLKLFSINVYDMLTYNSIVEDLLLKDKTNGKIYYLFMENGKLHVDTVSGNESAKDYLLIKDKINGKIYSLFMENNKLHTDIASGDISKDSVKDYLLVKEKTNSSIYHLYMQSNKLHASDAYDSITYNGIKYDLDNISFPVYNLDEDNTNKLEGRLVTAVSSKKFIYQRLYVDQKTYKVILDKKFRYCDNQGQYVLFINGRVVDNYNFLITIPKITRPFDNMYIYTAKFFNPEDRIELFYLPHDYTNINKDHSITLGKSGYISCDRTLLDYPLDNKNYMFFINGKKIPSCNIKNISTDMVRITRDTETVQRLDIYSTVSNDITYMKDYLKSSNKSQFEELIDDILSVDGTNELDVLLQEFITMSDSEDVIKMDVDHIALVNEIVRDFWVSSGYDYNAKPFIYDYELDDYITTDEKNGNKIIPALDAFPEININKTEMRFLYFRIDGEYNEYFEIGRKLVKPYLEWEYSMPPYSDTPYDIKYQKINNSDIATNLRITQLDKTISSDEKITIEGFNGFTVCNSTLYMKFCNGIYYGLVDEDLLDERDSDIYTNNPTKLLNDITKELKPDRYMDFTDYIIGNNKYFIFALPKRLAYDENGRVLITFFLPDIKSDIFLDTNIDDKTIPIFTNGKYVNEEYDSDGNLIFKGNLVELDSFKMELLADFSYTNEYNYTEDYVIFKSNGYFTRLYDDTLFNIYIR